MKIPPARIDAFIKLPDKGISFALVYGPDTGLVSEHTSNLCKAIVDDLSDPFRVAELSYSKIAEEPSVFCDEINAMCLTGGQRLIKIRTDSTSLQKNIGEIISASKSDTFVVFSAGDLSPSSSLRKFFEKEPNCASIPCYKDDASSIQKIISSQLAKNGFSFDNDVTQYLSHSFSGDRLVVRNEVEKLITYMGENQYITLEEVKDCIYDSSEFSLDELCVSFASRNAYETDRNMNKALKEGVSPIAITRLILRYFMRLQEVKNKMESGVNEQQAMLSLRPPVFFKQAPVFKKHLAIWKCRDISKVIKKFIELEIECKTTGNPADLLCARLLTILPLTVR